MTTNSWEGLVGTLPLKTYKHCFEHCLKYELLPARDSMLHLNLMDRFLAISFGVVCMQSAYKRFFVVIKLIQLQMGMHNDRS